MVAPGKLFLVIDQLSLLPATGRLKSIVIIVWTSKHLLKTITITITKNCILQNKFKLVVIKTSLEFECFPICAASHHMLGGMLRTQISVIEAKYVFKIFQKLPNVSLYPQQMFPFVDLSDRGTKVKIKLEFSEK